MEFAQHFQMSAAQQKQVSMTPSIWQLQNTIECTHDHRQFACKVDEYVTKSAYLIILEQGLSFVKDRQSKNIMPPPPLP